MGIILTSSAVERLHAGLVRVIRERLRHPTSVRPQAGCEGWERFAAKSVFFELRADEGRLYDAAQSGPSGRMCAVVPVDMEEVYNPAYRVGWSEEWVPAGDGNFLLVGAGWRLYWGGFGPRAGKTLLLRAEWADPAGSGGRAAQPHWHLGDREQGLHDLHLGMAGWTNGTGYPACWQFRAADMTESDLVTWADRVLEGILAELRAKGLL